MSPQPISKPSPSLARKRHRREGITCPKCDCPDSNVTETRAHTGAIKRRRKCLRCDAKYTTMEYNLESLPETDKSRILSLRHLKGKIGNLKAILDNFGAKLDAQIKEVEQHGED